MLDAVVVKPQATHKSTVIWLHGLGDSGDGFAPIVPELKLPEDLGIKFVFPHAPVRPVTINGGMAMRAWYDIASLDLENRADEVGVRESSAQVQALIQAEIDAGIAPERILLAGFSQGGVIALHLAPRLSHTLAGVMALSTYQCAPAKLAQEKTRDDFPIFMAHGRFDDVVPMHAGKAAFDNFANLGFNISWQDYPMAHQVCPEEIGAIRNWLIERLS